MENSIRYLGLSGFVPDFEQLDLGEGFILKKTYARVFGTTMAHFTPPPAEIHNTAPWVAVEGGFDFEIKAEVTIPKTISKCSLESDTVIDILVGLLRMAVRPQINAPAISTVSFSEAKSAANFTIQSHEIYTRHNGFMIKGPESYPIQAFDWLRMHLGRTLKLTASNPVLRAAIEVFTDIQFIKHRGLATISVWASLESIFKIESEIAHRVSACIATFLEEYGDKRYTLYQRCFALYKSRCAAAHQGKETEHDDLLESIVILRRVILKIIVDGQLPNRKNIEQAIFTSSSMPG